MVTESAPSLLALPRERTASDLPELVRVLKEGGYEGATSMVYYGLPTVWSPRIEEIIVKTAHTVVDRVKK